MSGLLSCPVEGHRVDGDLTPGAPAAAEAGAQPAAAQPSPGDSGDWLSDKAPSEENALFGELLRSGRATLDSSTTRPAEAASDGQSAPTEGDEAPTDPLRDAAGRFIPRRGIPKAVEAAEARAAEAEAKAAALDPEALKQQGRDELVAEQRQKVDAEAQARLSDGARAEAERYERLLNAPDHELSAEDYQWREDRKALLAAYPQADAHYRAEYGRRAQELDSRHNAVMNGIVAQMGTVGQQHGLDPEAWKAPGTTFADIAADIASAVEAKVRAEYREIETENRQLKLTGPRGLAAARTGLNGGMSNGGGVSANANDVFRRMLRGE